jgi:biofilm protein TabA
MRKVAEVQNDHPEIKQVMIYECPDGVYVFPFATLEDGSAVSDEYYQSVEEADAECTKRYGISDKDWKYIDDPLEHCQHDWIKPVRIKGRNVGKPEWGHFEILENGIWKDFIPNK